MTEHPSPEVLALFATLDLPVLDRWKVRRHVTGCEQCDRQLSIFRAARVELKRLSSTETLTGFEAIADWSRLEREMVGNIAVGLAAARCIEKTKVSRSILVKFAVAAGMSVLFALGWATHVPAEQTSRIYSAVRTAFTTGRQHENQGPILRSLPDGIVVGSQEGSLTILNPVSAVVTASGPAGVEARYVDDETGQVTITDVYGQ